MADRICTIPDCGKPRLARGWCSAHYTRWKRTGDPLTPPTRQRNVGTCSVDGCSQPSRKRGWCASHYSQWTQRGGVESFRWKWGTPGACPTCGAHVPTSRRYCSRECYVSDRARKAAEAYVPERPDATSCALCGCVIDLTERRSDGRRKRADTKVCRRCCQDSKKHGVSVHWLARRDGTGCSICDQPVDMTLRLPDRMSASVDHVIPRAAGGTNDPSNLRLAHLLCNQLKSDRVA